MNAALGVAGIVLGVTSCFFGLVVVAVALRQKRFKRLALARSYAFLALLGAVVAVAAMERALITRDFTVEFVAQHGSSRTPALFNVAALWSALEGSLLLWVLILSGYTVAVAVKFRRRLTDPLVGWTMAVMFAVGLFFFGLLAGPANPFRSFDPPIGFDGPGPNPLLQNHPLMAFHPPALYLGYVGFTVPFAFAAAALITGRLGEGWLVATRRWTLIAWAFLTVGIIAGAWWSYEVLGWAGYWAWDPVENASLLPWLTGTAYLHSVMMQERRGMLRVWNLSLLCATFSLTILGTFLTRSGVLQSVHAFSAGSVGWWLLLFFALVLALSVGLIGWRGDLLRSPGRIDSPLSREGAFLLNNVAFAAFAFVVLLGTIFPLVVELFQDRTIAVGPQYFNRMLMPVGFVLLFLMAVAPVLPWRKTQGEVLARRLLWPACIAVAAAALAVMLGGRGLGAVLAFFLGGFAGGAAARQVVLATRRQGWRGLVGRANGGMIVHLGVVLIAVAFAASNAYVVDNQFRLAVGQTATIGGHTVTYLGQEIIERPEKRSFVAQVAIDDGKAYAPSLNQFRTSGQVIGEPSVRSSWQGDVYLSLVEKEGDDGKASIRVVVQPLVVWLWVGGIMMFFGTLLAAFPGKGRRVPTAPTSAATPERPEGQRIPVEVG